MGGVEGWGEGGVLTNADYLDLYLRFRTGTPTYFPLFKTNSLETTWESSERMDGVHARVGCYRIIAGCGGYWMEEVLGHRRRMTHK